MNKNFPKLLYQLAIAGAIFLISGSASADSGGRIEISANDLNAACQAGGGHISVPVSLEINGGTANLTDECDITLAAGATVEILNATIDATHGDFDVCAFPQCGNNVKVEITNSTIIACPFCGVLICAPGSLSKIEVTDSTLSSNPGGGGTGCGGIPGVPGTRIVSEGKVEVSGTTFLIDTDPLIHGNVRCEASGNSPSTAVCN